VQGMATLFRRTNRFVPNSLWEEIRSKILKLSGTFFFFFYLMGVCTCPLIVYDCFLLASVLTTDVQGLTQ
jgi:hypothetical protein